MRVLAAQNRNNTEAAIIEARAEMCEYLLRENGGWKLSPYNICLVAGERDRRPIKYHYTLSLFCLRSSYFFWPRFSFCSFAFVCFLSLFLPPHIKIRYTFRINARSLYGWTSFLVCVAALKAISSEKLHL